MSSPADDARVRAVDEGDRPSLAAFVGDRWGSERMAVRGQLVHPTELEGFVAEAAGAGGTVVGYAAYEVRGDVTELVLLDVVMRGAGVGTALAKAVRVA